MEDGLPLFTIINVSCGGQPFFYKDYSDRQSHNLFLSWGGVEDGSPLFIIINVSCGGQPFFIRIILIASRITPTPARQLILLI